MPLRPRRTALAVVLGIPLLDELPTAVQVAGVLLTTAGLGLAVGLHLRLAGRWREPSAAGRRAQ